MERKIELSRSDFRTHESGSFFDDLLYQLGLEDEKKQESVEHLDLTTDIKNFYDKDFDVIEV